MKQRRRLPGALLLALALHGPAPAAERRTIPARFVGDWASSADRCLPGTFDIYNLRITPRSYEDQNGRVVFRRVAIAGPDAVQATGRMRGQDYNTSVSLALEDEGRMLVVGAEEDTSYYVRCKR